MDESFITTRRRQNPFVQIDKNVFEDIRMSWKAKGILGYLLSKPDGWKVYLIDLQKRSTDGRDSVSSGLKELESYGYLTKQMLRREGKFAGYSYEIFESPSITGSHKTENGKSEYGLSEYGKTENGKPATSNNELSNNDSTNKETNKNRKRESKQTPPKVKISYAQYVFMTQEEYASLSEKLGEPLAKDYIERLNLYIGSTGKTRTYKDHYLTILNWHRRDSENQKGAKSNEPTRKSGTGYSAEELAEIDRLSL